MSEQKKDIKSTSPEQKPIKRTIDTSKTRTGVQVFNDGFTSNENGKKPLNENKNKK